MSLLKPSVQWYVCPWTQHESPSLKKHQSEAWDSHRLNDILKHNPVFRVRQTRERCFKKRVVLYVFVKFRICFVLQPRGPSFLVQVLLTKAFQAINRNVCLTGAGRVQETMHVFSRVSKVQGRENANDLQLLIRMYHSCRRYKCVSLCLSRNNSWRDFRTESEAMPRYSVDKLKIKH